jgi:hypothetical protein
VRRLDSLLARVVPLGAVPLAVLAYAALAPAQDPPRAEPKPATAAPAASSASLARFVPRDGLYMCLECVGLDAEADSWKQTAASRVLSDTPTGAMLEEVAAQLLDSASAPTAVKRLAGADAVAVAEHLLHHGFISGSIAKAGATGAAPDPASLLNVQVFRNAGRKESRPLFGRLLGSMMTPTDKTQVATKAGKRRVVSVTGAGMSWAWWIDKDDLVIVQGDPAGADRVIDLCEGKGSSAINHPIRTELLKAEGTFRPLLCFFVDVDAFPAVPSAAGEFFSKANIRGVKRFDYRWGFDGQALASIARIAAPAPRQGLLTAFDQKPFTPKSAPPLPATLDGFTVVSVDLKSAYEKLVAAAPPAEKSKFESFEKSLEKGKTRVRLRDDLLAKLGPKLAFYIQPAKTSAAAESSDPLAGAMAMLRLPKLVVMAEMKDPKSFDKTLDNFIVWANKALEEQYATKAPGGDDPGARRGGASKSAAPKFRLSTPNPKTYILTLPAMAPGMPTVSITAALGKKHLILATASDAAKDALKLEAKPAEAWTPSGDLAKAIDRLPKDLVFFQVTDPKKSLPETMASLPMTLQTLGTTLTAAAAAKPPMQVAAAGPAGGSGAAGPAGGGDDEPGPGGRGRGRGRGARGGGSPNEGLTAAIEGQTPKAPAPAPEGAAATPAPSGEAAPFQIKVDPAKVPSPDAIRPLLFPGTMAIAADDQGIRVLARESFPDFAFGMTPAKAGIMLALFLPAMQQARVAARAAAEGKPIPPPSGPLFGSVPDAAGTPGAPRPPAAPPAGAGQGRGRSAAGGAGASGVD